MAEIILITGGTRSGKSDYALKRAEAVDGNRCFLATCVVSDDEMAERVEKHREIRDETRWQTIEERIELEDVIQQNDCHVYLIDCLTLWINNLMVDCYEKGLECTENFVATRTEKLLDTIETISGLVVIVTNEVGMGIVPENELARRYRDLVGLANRMIASRAAEVILVSCGLPLYLKDIK